ncbi:hypothetical protein LJR164_001847 [Phenylobacterium sp. LjRoot164]|uniref:hypothetical protein n=1 Tax=unclassified Phenylobacterium TaxID=2640670 RepID=UPI003ED03F03
MRTLRINSMADYTPSRLYYASFKWQDVGYTVDQAVERYMELHPDADEAAVRAEIVAAAS